MFKVGITGGIGAGKTTVTGIFEGFGIDVIDADLVAREVVEPGQPALKHIAEHFGDDMLMADGSLNRRLLREKVFNQPSEKLWLEELLHPEVFRICRERMDAARSLYTILSSPLLIESGEYELVNRVLVVDVPEQVQLSRTAARDQAPPEQIQQIIEQQMSRAERLKHADDVLDNSGDHQSLAAAVAQLHTLYLRFAQEQIS